MLLVIRDVEPEAFDRAAMRWLAKLCTDLSRATLGDIAEAVKALEALPQNPAAARQRLARVCEHAGLLDAARVLTF